MESWHGRLKSIMKLRDTILHGKDGLGEDLVIASDYNARSTRHCATGLLRRSLGPRPSRRLRESSTREVERRCVNEAYAWEEPDR